MARREEELARKQTWLERVYAAPNGDPPGVVRPLDPTGLPDFFVIGPPRTGTTWLYEVLHDHTTLPSPTKETRFFDAHYQRGLDWYRAHFPASNDGRPMGEIAPTYFASVETAERIAALVPHAKIVCVFRNPVERVMSLYKLKCAYGLIPWTFEQAIARDPEMIESSRYATKLEAWQRVMGKGQILCVFYDDLRHSPQSFLDQVVDFIDVPRFQLTDAQTQCVHASETMTRPRSYHRTRRASTMADWFKARRLDRLVAAVRNSPLRGLFLGGGQPFAELPIDSIVRLYELFRPEVEALEGMLNCDLAGWKWMGEHSLSRNALHNDRLVLRPDPDAM